MKKIIFKIISLFPEKFLFLLIKLFAYSKAYNSKPDKALKFLFAIDKEIYGLEGFAAQKYDEGLHAKHRLTNYHEFFIENIEPNTNILDIGCGNGALDFDIAKNVEGVKITGIDLNGKNIELANRTFKSDNIEYIIGDATKDLPNKKFDIVILSNVLEHIEKRIEFLRKIGSLYNPSFLLIRVPMFDRDWRIPLIKELGLDYRLDDTHFIEYTIAEFEKEMELSGLSIAKHKINWGEIWAKVTSSSM